MHSGAFISNNASFVKSKPESAIITNFWKKAIFQSFFFFSVERLRSSKLDNEIIILVIHSTEKNAENKKINYFICIKPKAIRENIQMRNSYEINMKRKNTYVKKRKKTRLIKYATAGNIHANMLLCSSARCVTISVDET